MDRDDGAPDEGWGAAPHERGFADLFDLFWDSTVSDGVTAAEVAAMEDALRLPPASRVLVAPFRCGRHALALAARGHLVLGVDRCPQAVDRARLLAARAGTGAAFRLCASLSTPGDASFDGAVCVGQPPEPAPLASLAASLRPGGRAVVECGPDGTRLPPSLRAVRTLDGLGGAADGRLYLLCERV